jgi:predicted nucleotidyltransferase
MIDLVPLEAALRQQSGVQLAVLFGSAATGLDRSGSDLDIGVLVDGDEALQLMVTLSRAVGRTVDVVMLNTASPLLRFEIARDGRVVLERAPHLWTDFRARAMVDWWDWAPLARRFRHAAALRLRTKAVRGSL